MTDATSTPGADGTRGEGRTGKGTGADPTGTHSPTHSPLVAPAGTEAPGPGTSRTDRTEGRAETDKRRESVPGGMPKPTQGDRASGLRGTSGHESRLLPHEECDKLSTRLQHAVAGFVDEPRSAVEEADHVLEEVAARFADAVKQRRRTLRSSWQAGDGGQDKAVGAGDTEQLRLALRDYRELTERLLHS